MSVTTESNVTSAAPETTPEAPKLVVKNRAKEAPAGTGIILSEKAAGQIKQIIWNLATNGLRAMPGGGRLILSAAMDPSSEGILLSVRDEGVGIPDDELGNVFEPFQGRFAKGTGLGLAIVRRAVEALGGEVNAQSDEERGCHFWFRIPQAPH